MYKSIHPGVVIDAGITLLNITESNKAGLRLLKSNPENHGDIGQDAVDLSTQTVTSDTSGAQADYSFAVGKNTTANALYSTVLGVSNIGLEDTVLEVGIGTNAVPANALEVYTDGTITAPEATDDLIKERGEQALLTKSYGVVSDIDDGGIGSIKVNNLVKISQVDYDNLTPNSDTLYAII